MNTVPAHPVEPGAARRPGRTNATRQKLFDASMSLIGERGPASVTVDEIAAAAGVSKGTVYYNFGSKSELVGALLEYGVQELQTKLASTQQPSTDALSSLELMVGALLDFFVDYPSFAQLLVSEMWRTPSEWRETLTMLRERLVRAFSMAVLRVADEHSVNSQLDPNAVSGALFGATFVMGLDRQVFHPERSRDAALAAVMTVMRGYLR